jgi:hypothetical protein
VPDAGRSVELELPARAGSAAVCVRLCDPFGDGSLALLLVELCPGEARSPLLERVVVAPAPLAAARAGAAVWLLLLVALALVALLWPLR